MNKKIIRQWWNRMEGKWINCTLEQMICPRCKGTEIEFNVKSENTDSPNAAKCKECELELVIEEIVKTSEHSLTPTTYIPIGTKRSTIRRVKK